MKKIVLKDRFNADIEKNPITYIVMYVLLALACISFPSKFLSGTMGTLNALGLIRIIFGTAGIIFMVMSGFTFAFKAGKSLLKNFDIIIVGLAVAINNFPIIALINKDITVTSDAASITSYIFFCFSVGFFEEIFFRGLIMSVFFILFKKKKAGNFWAIVISSAIFGLVHLVNLFSGAGIGGTFLQVGYTFLNGMIFALLYYFTKSIYFSIICHTLFDIGGLMTDAIAKVEPGKTIWDTTTIILTAVIGAAAGIYLCLRFLVNQQIIFKRKNKNTITPEIESTQEEYKSE